MDERKDDGDPIIHDEVVKIQESKHRGDTPEKKNVRADILGVLLIFPLVLLASSDGALLVGNEVMIMADLNVNVVIFGLIIGLGILSGGIATFTFGYLSDKRSRKLLLLVGGATWSSATLLMSMAPNSTVLFIIRILATIGNGAITPVVFSLLSDMFPSEKRSNSFAWWGIANLIGSLAGGSIALAFNRIPFDTILGWDDMDLLAKMHHLQTNYPDLVSLWRLPFILTGILGLVFVGLAILVKEPKRGARDKQLRDALSKEELHYSYQIKRSDLKYIFTRRSNFWLIFNFLDVVVSGFFIANILLYIQVEMQFSFTDAESIAQILLMVVPAVLLGLFGQFYFAKVGDKRVERGDPAGRVKVAIMGGLLHIPFFVAAFMFSPFKGNSTFFLGSLAVPSWGFWMMMPIGGVILGIGLMYSFAIAPNWYASLIDVNLPEHRSTMIATASFLDTIGRSFGSIMGGLFISFFDSTGTHYSISLSIIWMTIVFGGISGLMWIPIYKYCNDDFSYVQRVLEERGKELRDRLEKK
nr:MFS transporter [Candidatus Sigynarchaeum springense]MDO8119281.1 MFS transporter [Candidatus Sigynarchaeota archaeon]